MTRSISCQGCGTAATATGSSVGAEARSTGFEPYMNTRNGLEVTWLCPNCERVVASALARIALVFGDEARNVYLSTKLAKAGRAPNESEGEGRSNG